jgi:deazaflavin-dependent oxidoreductase (nitroreductase family)
MTIDSNSKRRAIPSIVQTLSPLVRRLLRLGVPMGDNALLTVRGRTSGKPRTLPVTILPANGRQYVFAAFGEVNWVHNLRAAGEGTLKHGRRSTKIKAVELTPEEAAPILQAGLAAALKMPLVGSMIGGWYGITTASTPADYQAAARVHAGFELRPVSS